MPASSARFELIWLRKLTNRMLEPIVIYYDNQSCLKLFENLVFHDRYRHIDIWYHFIRDSSEGCSDTRVCSFRFAGCNPLLRGSLR
jgi:hypothetical protein